jgi:AcrR family transcriptional regulator
MATRTTQKIKTRDKMLDVAEELFSEHGFDCVSIRDITEASDVNLSGVNYHFESKKNLFQEVIARRASILNFDRRTELEAIDLDALPPEESVRAIVRAFVYPIFLRSTEGGAGWKNYCRLIARQTKLRNGPNLTAKLFNPLALELIRDLKVALPKLGNRNAHYAFQYLEGATICLFTENDRLDVLSGGTYTSHDLDSLCDQLMDFATGGILALAKQ